MVSTSQKLIIFIHIITIFIQNYHYHSFIIPLMIVYFSNNCSIIIKYFYYKRWALLMEFLLSIKKLISKVFIGIFASICFILLIIFLLGPPPIESEFITVLLD